MQTHSLAFRSLGIVLSAALLVIALRFPGDSGAEVVPNPDHGKIENAVTLPNLLVHYYRPPNSSEIAFSLVLSVVALAGISMFVARLAAHRRIFAGTAAAVASAVVALLFITATAQHLPASQTIFMGIGGSFLVGLAAAWLAGRWWPNTS